jgi:hypothetical protein
MRTSTAIVALFLFAGVSQLAAQDNRSGSGGATTSNQGTMKLPGAGEKIPAHQQPKASDVPTTTSSNDQLSAEDKALDRKLKGICRGC